AFFLSDNAGTGWRRTATRGGSGVENGRCRIVPADSRVIADRDPVTVEIAVQFQRGFEGTKLVYAYGNAFGDTRNTGWREVGTWRVKPAGTRPTRETMAEATANTTDPNDLPIAELNRPDTAYQQYLSKNPGATELTHGQGKLLFQPSNGKRSAVVGPVTHR